MTTYTYEVDHGDDSPAIKAGMEINGGKLTAVQFDAALARLEKLEDAAHDLINKLDMCGIDDSLIRIGDELAAVKLALNTSEEPT